MRKLIAFMHISLDGFVAVPNGEMDWITFDQELFDHIGKRISETPEQALKPSYQIIDFPKKSKA